jgi:hypothetical protein
VHRSLSEPAPHTLEAAIVRLAREQRRQTRWLTAIAVLFALTLAGIAALLLR